MKKKLNLFCVFMLLLMAIQVVMSFVMGADDFARGWEDGIKAGPDKTGGSLLELLGALLEVGTAITSFVCFFQFILNVNRNEVFVWDNVLLLRLTGISLLLLALTAAGMGLHEGASLTDVYNHTIDMLIFCVFNMIVAEVFAVGLKLKEEQDLTI